MKDNYYDGVPLQDYLKIDEDIAVYELPINNDIVKDIKKINSGEVENEDKDEHAKKASKLTKKDILNALSVVRNGLRQVIISNEMFIKLTEVKTFYEKSTI